MKKICFAILVCVVINSGTAQTWEWLNPLPQGYPLFDIEFDNNNAYAVGEYGTVLKSIDGGLTWNTLSTGTTATWWSLSITGSGTIYLAGMNGIILKSVDGGDNWIMLPTGTTTWILAIDFPDEQTGYALDGIGNIFKTTNGGTSWNNQTPALNSS